MNIGNKLRSYRMYKGLSQELLSEKAGINEKYYSSLERNKNSPTIDMIIKICSALEIDILEFFLYELNCDNNYFYYNLRLVKIIIDGLKNNIDIHFNRDCLLEGCEKSIWYNGYIGSMSFDEFELKIYAVGNIKGKLFLNFESVLDLNNEDISFELRKYVKTDKQLISLIEYIDYDEEILIKKNGNVLFLLENNWLTAHLINNNTNKVINKNIILDEDNILDVFSNKQAFIDFIFKNI